MGKYDFLSRFLSSFPPCSLLEIGCGDGRNLSALPPHITPYSIDLNAPAPIIASATHLPFRPSSFDIVMLIDVLEHIPDHRLAISEVFRVLKPNGIVLLSVPTFPSLWSKHDDLTFHQRRYTKASLSPLLTPFSPILLSYWVFLLFPLAVLLKLSKRLSSSSKTDYTPLPSHLNSLLSSFLYLENILILNFIYLPIGTSLIYIGRKP
jgi:SAM-dependent methyltransferase